MIRLDRYAPEWAIGIVEDLEAGESGREAVARAAENLRNQATEADQRAAEYAERAATCRAMIGTFICAEDLTREHTEHADEHRRYADVPAHDRRQRGQAQGRVHRHRGVAALTAFERNTLPLAASVLEAAGAYCDNGWTQGIYARDDRGQGCGATCIDAACWCASGAITLAMHRVVGTAASARLWNTALGEAEATLKRAIFARWPDTGDCDSIIVWNDATGRTQAEVVATFHHAAGELRARLAA